MGKGRRFYLVRIVSPLLCVFISQISAVGKTPAVSVQMDLDR